MNDQVRLNELLEKYCDTQLSTEEMSELESILDNNPAAQEQYIKFMDLNGRLTRLLSGSRIVYSSRVETGGDDSSHKSNGSKPLNPAAATGNPPPTPFGFGTSAFSFFALALVACSVIGWLVWQNGSTNSSTTNASANNSSTTNTQTQPVEQFAAQVTKKIDCDIESSRWKNLDSGKIKSGETILIEKGLLGLKFGSGATVALEGPAEFKVVSEKKGFLYFGKITAYAPPEAKGFTIETPTSRAVDLGTEFGISVGEKGVTEAHVFDGEVILYGPNDLKNEGGLSLTANQGSRIAESFANATELKASPESFMRIPSPMANSDLESRTQPFEDDHQLRLWLDASRQIQIDDQYRVVSWGDLLTEENSNSEYAWQIDKEKRPFSIADGIGGHPTVRFMGHEHLITEPFSTGNNVSVFAVLKMLPQKLRPTDKKPAILSFGSRDLNVFRNPGNQVVGRMSGFWQNGKRKYSGLVTSQDAVAEEAFVLELVYNFDANETTLLINGSEVDKARAHLPSSLHKSRIIGARNDGTSGFVGDVSEIMIFDSAIDKATGKNITEYLSKKYSIE